VADLSKSPRSAKPILLVVAAALAGFAMRCAPRELRVDAPAVATASSDPMPECASLPRLHGFPRDPSGSGLARDGGVEGSLPKKAIAEVFWNHQGELRSCYEKAMASGVFTADIDAQWSIDPDGGIAALCFDRASPGTPKSFLDCLGNQVRSWRFPEPRGGGYVSVRWPWWFRPDDGGSPGAPGPSL